jgi:hypothetical protein
MITSNSGLGAIADSSFEPTGVTQSPWPLLRAFSAAAAIRIHVDGDDTGGSRSGSRQRQDTRAGPNIRYMPTSQVEPIDKVGKELAGKEPSWVKYRRADEKPKPRRSCDAGRAPLKDQVIREKMYRSAQATTPKPLRN